MIKKRFCFLISQVRTDLLTVSLVAQPFHSNCVVLLDNLLSINDICYFAMSWRDHTITGESTECANSNCRYCAIFSDSSSKDWSWEFHEPSSANIRMHHHNFKYSIDSQRKSLEKKIQIVFLTGQESRLSRIDSKSCEAILFVAKWL